MIGETELERDLELERRKVRDLQETSRERDKEYQKLKERVFILLKRPLIMTRILDST
jgi:E3 ubiquitin-protein ligase CCNP1IP1